MSVVCATGPLTLRPHADIDECSLTGLFTAAFGRPLPADSRRCRFRHGPLATSPAESAWDGRLLVGRRATATTTLLVRGTTVKTAMIAAAVVRPDFQGSRIMRKMAVWLQVRAAEQGYDLLWTSTPPVRLA